MSKEQRYQIVHQMGMDAVEILDIGTDIEKADEKFTELATYIINNKKRGVVILISNIEGALQNLIIK